MLDSSIVIEALRGNSRVLARIDSLEEDEAVLAAPVLAELLVGARKTRNPGENLRRVEALAASMRFESFGRGAAERYSVLRVELEGQGRKRTDFDLAIASIAIDIGATLVTRDDRFADGGIPELDVENWATSESG